jgi:hypothetical protein
MPSLLLQTPRCRARSTDAARARAGSPRTAEHTRPPRWRDQARSRRTPGAGLLPSRSDAAPSARAIALAETTPVGSSNPTSEFNEIHSLGSSALTIASATRGSRGQLAARHRSERSRSPMSSHQSAPRRMTALLATLSPSSRSRGDAAVARMGVRDWPAVHLTGAGGTARGRSPLRWRAVHRAPRSKRSSGLMTASSVCDSPWQCRCEPRPADSARATPVFCDHGSGVPGSGLPKFGSNG